MSLIKSIGIAVVILIAVMLLLPLLVPFLGALMVNVLKIIIVAAAVVWIIKSIPEKNG